MLVESVKIAGNECGATDALPRRARRTTCLGQAGRPGNAGTRVRVSATQRKLDAEALRYPGARVDRIEVKRLGVDGAVRKVPVASCGGRVRALFGSRRMERFLELGVAGGSDHGN
jgi:hypothetical protein